MWEVVGSRLESPLSELLIMINLFVHTMDGTVEQYGKPDCQASKSIAIENMPGMTIRVGGRDGGEGKTKGCY